jgi:hypothetical protein
MFRQITGVFVIHEITGYVPEEHNVETDDVTGEMDPEENVPSRLVNRTLHCKKN